MKYYKQDDDIDSSKDSKKGVKLLDIHMGSLNSQSRRSKSSVKRKRHTKSDKNLQNLDILSLKSKTDISEARIELNHSRLSCDQSTGAISPEGKH